MYVVMTSVKLKPNAQKDCAELFRATNPDLVRSQPDWVGARMLFDEATNVATVLATWRNIASYQKLAQSAAFRQTMQAFAPHFASKPEVTIQSLLVDMLPEG